MVAANRSLYLKDGSPLWISHFSCPKFSFIHDLILQETRTTETTKATGTKVASGRSTLRGMFMSDLLGSALLVGSSCLCLFSTGRVAMT
uniref:Uncharacterized protein n=1 Tax=Arundo donax TaxID=35708 RepID=A0A0A8ZZK8_ARUDO